MPRTPSFMTGRTSGVDHARSECDPHPVFRAAGKWVSLICRCFPLAMIEALPGVVVLATQVGAADAAGDAVIVCGRLDVDLARPRGSHRLFAARSKRSSKGAGARFMTHPASRGSALEACELVVFCSTRRSGVECGTHKRLDSRIKADEFLEESLFENRSRPSVASSEVFTKAARHSPDER
jgi:hypothetical protein